MDIMKSIVAAVEERDHKKFVVKDGEELAAEIWAQMESDGYKFACAPALENGEHSIYFTKEDDPKLRM